MLYKQNRTSEALEEYRKAININPNLPEISNSLALVLRDLCEFDEALGLMFNAIIKSPKEETYALNIAETLIMLYEKNSNKAKKIAKNWLKTLPDNDFAQHINYVFEGKENPNANKYCQKLFDLFAETFEETLKNIDYKLPQIIKEELGNIEGTIIDLGCGTGLIGQALKNTNNEIIGVDISEKMLNIAKEKSSYKELIKADIVSYCQEIPNADWVVAGDVFGYVGNIEPIIKSVAKRNFCFSVASYKSFFGEYKLNKKGRYQHNPNHVKKLLQKYGYLNIISKDIVLRKENGKNVNGVLFIAKGENNE